nr:MAG TPA: hypothetical protein [Caudoviricetes sp.]
MTTAMRENGGEKIPAHSSVFPTAASAQTSRPQPQRQLADIETDNTADKRQRRQPRHPTLSFLTPALDVDLRLSSQHFHALSSTAEAAQAYSRPHIPALKAWLIHIDHSLTTDNYTPRPQFST